MENFIFVPGVLKSPEDERDYKAKDYLSMGVHPEEYVPSIYAPVLNQGSIGSCVAHAIVTMKWYQRLNLLERSCSIDSPAFNLYKESLLNSLSTDYVYHNRLASDWQGRGMYVREALSQLLKCGVCEKEGLPSNTEYPSNTIKYRIPSLQEESEEFKIQSYVRCDDIDDLCNTVYLTGAAIISIEVVSSFNGLWMNSETIPVLTLPEDDEKVYGCHCVCVIGYTREGIIIQNSWGNFWGHNGLAILPYDYPIVEMWGVIDKMDDYTLIEMQIDSKEAIVNGEMVTLDTPPRIINDRTMIPIRYVAEWLGCEVLWDSSTKSILIKRRN